MKLPLMYLTLASKNTKTNAIFLTGSEPTRNQLKKGSSFTYFRWQ